MDLLRRFALGEIDAFETLVRQFQGDIYAWIVRIVRDPGIAEDLTVETLWRIYRAHHQFRTDGNFAGWARRVATNLALDYLRRNRPEQSLLALQVAATLVLVEEQPYEEIADALGTSVGAVKLRVFRAVRILRKQLSHRGVRP